MVGMLTPTQRAAVEQSRRFRAKIALQAALLAADNRPNIPVPVEQQEPTNVKATQPVRRREYTLAHRTSQHIPLAKRILYAIANEFGMTIDELRSPVREAKYTIPRHIATGLILEMTNLSLPAVGKWMGGRDHTTVINSRRRARVMFAEEAFRNRLDQIKAEIEHG